jgi:hypothetical protein
MVSTSKGGAQETAAEYEESIFGRKDLTHLRGLAIKGATADPRLRTFCWRVRSRSHGQVFLGIIPDTGDPKEWVKGVQKARDEMREHQESINAFKLTDLDPNQYNPLMKATPVPSSRLS